MVSIYEGKQGCTNEPITLLSETFTVFLFSDLSRISCRKKLAVMMSCILCVCETCTRQVQENKTNGKQTLTLFSFWVA